MKKSKDKDDFLKKPQFIGGDQAMKDFVAKNMKYPEEAIAAKIEGKVLISYDVTDNGKVINAKVVNGIGYGCDEEALRLVNLFKFSKVRNRKMRVKVSKRTSINFRLPKKQTQSKVATKVNYTITSSASAGDEKSKSEQNKSNTGYSYTIKYNKPTT